MVFAHWLDPDVYVDAPLVGWYIEGPGKKILADTGGGDPATLTAPGLMPYKREKHQAVENALAGIGVKCEEIDVVIATHLHWEHCAGNRLFPNAKIIVQEDELRSARAPLPIQYGYLQELIENVNYTVISGDMEIDKGVRTILAPGHTYGLQGVLVEAKEARYLIASDSICLFESLEHDPPLISGVYVDLKIYYETLEKIRKLSAYILPGHDFKVFERELYT